MVNDERQRTLVERIRTAVERHRMEREGNENDGRTQRERVRVKNDIFTVRLGNYFETVIIPMTTVL